jgi:secreted trypsin-like serine protease
MARRGFVTILSLLALLVASPAQAITYGEEDGNRHPNVGALIAEDEPGKFFVLCSGTLVAANLFLTAAHCVDGDLDELVGVSFHPEPLNNLDSVIEIDIADITLHPDYPGPESDPHDLAVITLPEELNIDPASLPEENQFTAAAKNQGLKGQKFTAVGYGRLERQHEPGGGEPTLPRSGIRMFAVSEFRALNDAWLRLSQNPATGDGGTCFGDSGGPNFLGAPNGKTGVLAAVTVTGDAVCRSTNVVYRLDTASAQEFLSTFGLVDPPGANAAETTKSTKESKDRKSGKRDRNRR